MNDTRCYDPKQRAQEKLLEADTLEAGTFPSQHRAKCAAPVRKPGRPANRGGCEAVNVVAARNCDHVQLP
jgi:hypothetical protein